MEREIPAEDLKKLYSSNDMVKADCNGCRGCHSCCQGMGGSIILDPMDIHNLRVNLGVSFEELLAERIELQVAEGIVLPNLKMAGKTESCSFLDGDGRCSIHSFRPGLCRLFPLGRYYENGRFFYYLQSRECPKPDKTKVKVKKWLGIPELRQYEGFVADWHYFLKDLSGLIEKKQDDRFARECSMYILDTFYRKPFDKEDFYGQFSERLILAQKLLGIDPSFRQSTQ